MVSLDKIGLRSLHLYGLSLTTILICIGLWVRAKTIGEDERANAERRALFVGLWPPMFWLIGDALRREETRRASLHAGPRLWARPRAGGRGRGRGRRIGIV